MHEVALLRAEVEELREANSRLSKRRKAKKKISPEWRIAYSTRCKGLIDQRRVEGELREERRRRRGQPRHAETRARRCGRCGMSGHNSRGCREDAEEIVESSIEVAN